MKRQICQLLSIAFAIICIACTTQPDNKWKLVWEDNFDQKDGFDTSVWSKIPRGRSDWSNYMSDFDSLYVVENSHLILRGINNTTQKQDTAQFLTGGVYTFGKKEFNGGRFEIRARLESAQGAWPAFWLLPINNKWPTTGEIDIMEHLNFDDAVYQTIHTDYTFNLGIKDPTPGSFTQIDKDGYNTYAVEIYPDSICFFVNDVKNITYPRLEGDIEGQFPFNDQPFYLLLDMQLGGSWVGSVDPEQLPVAMYIDWVRYYQEK